MLGMTPNRRYGQPDVDLDDPFQVALVQHQALALAEGDLTNHIRNHWFVGNESDALRQNNTASRTWWIANTAIKAAKASGGAFTEEEAIRSFRQQSPALPQHDGLELQQTSCRIR